MALTVTEIYRKPSASGNAMDIGYKLAFTGTYVTGGYTVNNTNLPGAAQDFNKIYGIKHEYGQLNPETGDLLWIDPDGVDNDDSTNPSFTVELYQEATGGGFDVVPGGGNIDVDFYIAVTGVPKGSIDGYSGGNI